MSDQPAEFTFGSWSVPQIQLMVEYPLEVLDEIRSACFDGLQQLSHGGLEIGGVIFGARKETAIRLLTWRPIPCEHAHGPSFKLSPKDSADLARLLDASKEDPDLEGLQPVGWFLSHTRGSRTGISLTDSDQEIYQAFFPWSWQVTLILRPGRNGDSRAGFFAREADGSLRAESSYSEFTIEPMHRAPDPRAVAGQRASVESKDERGASPRKEALTEAPRLVEQRPPRRGRWLWAVPGCLALLIAGMLAKERYLAPRDQSFSLRVGEAGEQLRIEWDRDAASVRASRRALIDIKDGGSTSQFPLTPEQLREGNMTYPRRSGDVELRMTVYSAGGSAVQEFARFVGASKEPTTPTEVQRLRAERDRLQGEVKQLREELRQETVRGDRARDSVRILENRIAVDKARGGSAAPPSK